MFRFFLKHTYRDIGRHKCHFCLALCSVLIVVLSTLVVNTITSKGPIIFLKLAQTDSGEIDCVYTPQYDRRQDNSNLYWNDTWSLNFTQAVAVMDKNAIVSHMAPRYQMCPDDDQIQLNNTYGE